MKDNSFRGSKPKSLGERLQEESTWGYLLLQMFMGFLGCAAVIYLSQLTNNLSFPGLWKKVLYAIMILSVLLVFAFRKSIWESLWVIKFNQILPRIHFKQSELKSVINSCFGVALILFLLLLLIRIFQDSFLEFINAGYFLIILIILGVLTVLTRGKN